MKKISKIVFAVAVCVLAACSANNKRKTELGEYVYVEGLVLHVDIECADVSKRIRTQKIYKDFDTYIPYRLCNKCVDDEIATKIERIIEKNKELVRMYDKLRHEYKAEYIGWSEEDFLDLTTNAKKREALYNHSVSRGDFNGSKEEFDAMFICELD